MRSLLLTVCLIAPVTAAEAQKFVLTESQVSFYSHAPIEDITAVNKKTSALFNSATSEIVFSVPIKEFDFAKSLMKEHFNEKYMESEKFPRATFQGKLEGFEPNKMGTQTVKAVGKLTIHGVVREISESGTVEVKGENLLMKSKFKVKLEDYQIVRPQILWQNIAEEVEVTLDFVFKPQ